MLEVNIEGSYIHKGSPILIGDDNRLQNTIDEAFRRSHATITHFTYNDYCHYNENFLKRTRVNIFFNNASYCLTGLVVTCALMGAQLLSFVFLILLIICMTIARLLIDIGDTPIKLFDLLGLRPVLS